MSRLSICFSALVLGLVMMAGCNDLASKKDVRKALAANSENCAVDLNALNWANSSGKELISESRISFAKKYQSVRDLLLKKKIRWEFSMEPELAKRCKLDRKVILASPGVLGLVDHIHWALKTLILQEELGVSVQRVRVIVTHLKGIELYAANRAARAQLNSSGERVLDFFVNLGDSYAGISFTNLMKNFTDHDVADRGAKILRNQKQSLSR
jgi:hypothetical protein